MADETRLQGGDRINLSMTTMDCVLALAEGNPGACTVMADLLANGAAIDPDSALGGLGPVLALDTHRIYGPDIWIFYKDLCGQSIHRVSAVLRAVQLGHYSEHELHDAIAAARQGRPADLTAEKIDALYDGVCARLAQFQRDPSRPSPSRKEGGGE